MTPSFVTHVMQTRKIWAMPDIIFFFFGSYIKNYIIIT